MVFHTKWALKTGKIYICFLCYLKENLRHKRKLILYSRYQTFFFLLAQFVGSIFSIDLIAHHADPSSFPLGGKKNPTFS